ncbi:MAG: DUF1566 domain-containing protein [Sulfuricurvum sp.]|nr:DUF1566 domain-containing protein [Sulfuricurvum sp.]
MKKYSLILLSVLSFTASAQVHLSSSENLTQENAIQYCRDLGSSWRTLSIQELFTLPKTTPFNVGFSYWSGMQIISGNAITGTGSEGDGGVIEVLGYSFFPKERNITLSPPTKKIAVVCTNIPEIKQSRNYRLTPQGTEDKGSGLLWHSLDATDKRAKYSFEQAKEMCENLTLNGRSWRLPSSDELYGIVDTAFLRPSVDMKFFGPMMHRYYWTGDLLNSQEAYAVGFKLGSVATVSKSEAAHVRCVSEE